MPEPIDLKLYKRPVQTVFDLLGSKEDDMTYAVGWGLAQSHALAHAVLADCFEREVGDLSALLLQESRPNAGRTDIEIQTTEAHLVIEAKRGWDLPGFDQLEKYAAFLRHEDERQTAIAVVSECSADYPPVREILSWDLGVPVVYLPWSRLAALVTRVRGEVRAHAEKRLLAELHRYLKGLMTSQSVRSNMVYVVSLNHDAQDWTDLTFVQTVMDRNLYYNPVGGSGSRWPKTPPNYLGFRYDGKLQRVSHVEHYEVVTKPHDFIPEVKDWVNWTDEPHFLYTLGPALPLPDHEVRSTQTMRNRRVEVALDLLLTCDTIPEAVDRTRERLAEAGEE